MNYGVYSNGIDTIVIDYDENADNPREWGHVGTMACWYGNYNLGDYKDVDRNSDMYVDNLIIDYIGLNKLAKRLETTGIGNFKVKKLRNKEAREFYEANRDDFNPRDYNTNYAYVLYENDEPINCDDKHYIDDLIDVFLNNLSMAEKIELLKESNKIIMLPLSVYEHSGITMSVGSKWNYPDAQWDASDVGFIWISIKKAYEEYGNLKGNMSHPDIKTIEEYLKVEVEIYDSYLTGAVFGYTVYKETSEEGSCTGFYGYPDLKNDKTGIFVEAGISDLSTLKEFDNDNNFDIEEFLLKNYPDLYEEKEEEVIIKRVVKTVVRKVNVA